MATSTLSSNLQSINYNRTVESDGVSDRRHRYAHQAIAPAGVGEPPDLSRQSGELMAAQRGIEMHHCC
jgi:hypothetical protein